MTEHSLYESIRAALSPRGSRILPFSDLARRILGPDASDRDEETLRAAVQDLERKGQIVRVRGEKLSLIEHTGFIAGALAIKGEGKAFLLSGVRGVPDTAIARGALNGAMDGDFVLARVEEPAKPKKAARGTTSGGKGRGGPHRPPRELATVLKILVRRHQHVVGKIARGADGTLIIPFDKKVDALLQVPYGKDLDAPTGVFVDALIVSYPNDDRVAQAEVLEIIGFEGDPGVDVEVVSRKWGIPRTFAPETLAEADAATGTLDAAERARRTDFSSRVIVTIDGETARDFDDAIEAEALPNGGFRVGIHIADVSHYVRPGSRLDAEAFERGTSVYFPDRAIHMLPEKLSAGHCSLRPLEEKRTVSAVLTLAPSGETVKAEFHRSLIVSRQRLTYTAVAAFFEGATTDTTGIGSEVGDMLRVAKKAGDLLRKRRSERGSLDFDLPDADVILGETGDIVAITKAVRNEAHRLIEELMLAANEAVAKHLESVPSPALYRVHDRPADTRIADLRAVLEPLGYHIPEDVEDVTPKVFQAILEQAEGKPEERFVSDLVLRSQKKALYTEECRGHYALATKHYAHFTSPIRRYPDLLVHRALCDWIDARRAPRAEHAEGTTAWLKTVAGPHCSARERRAESAEREAIAWKKFVFLSKRVGEDFDAYVSAVVPFGLFVTLADIYVDGLVPIDTLEDDFYRYEEVEQRLMGANTGRIFRLGDRVRVKLARADSDRRALDFVLAGDSRRPRSQGRMASLERHASKPKPSPRGKRR